MASDVEQVLQFITSQCSTPDLLVQFVSSLPRSDLEEMFLLLLASARGSAVGSPTPSATNRPEVQITVPAASTANDSSNSIKSQGNNYGGRSSGMGNVASVPVVSLAAFSAFADVVEHTAFPPDGEAPLPQLRQVADGVTITDLQAFDRINSGSASGSPQMFLHKHHRNHQSDGSMPQHLFTTHHSHQSGEDFFGSMSLKFKRSVKEFDTLHKETDAEGNKVIQDYVMIAELGRGNQGKVKLACRKDDPNELVAIKIVNKSVLAKANRRDGLAQLKREIAIMKKLRHRNIVSLHAVVDDPMAHKMYLVMDYIPKGALLKALTDAERADMGNESDDDDNNTTSSSGNASKGTHTFSKVLYHAVDEKTAQRYMRQLIDGLRYLHKHGIIHHDIKVENCLLGDHGRVYLADFGVSSVTNGEATSMCTQHQGTPAYWPPSFFETTTEQRALSPPPAAAAAAAAAPRAPADANESSTLRNLDLNFPPEEPAHAPSESSPQSLALLGEEHDLWSLGVLFFVMLTGRLPFKGSSLAELAASVRSGPLQFPSDVRLSPAAKALIAAMLQKDPKQRLTLAQLRDHDFFGGKDNRSAMMRGSVLVAMTPDDIENAITEGYDINPGIRFMLIRGRRLLRAFIARIRKKIADRKLAALEQTVAEAVGGPLQSEWSFGSPTTTNDEHGAATGASAFEGRSVSPGVAPGDAPLVDYIPADDKSAVMLEVSKTHGPSHHGATIAVQPSTARGPSDDASSPKEQQPDVKGSSAAFPLSSSSLNAAVSDSIATRSNTDTYKSSTSESSRRSLASLLLQSTDRTNSQLNAAEARDDEQEPIPDETEPQHGRSMSTVRSLNGTRRSIGGARSIEDETQLDDLVASGSCNGRGLSVDEEPHLESGPLDPRSPVALRPTAPSDSQRRSSSAANTTALRRKSKDDAKQGQEHVQRPQKTLSSLPLTPRSLQGLSSNESSVRHGHASPAAAVATAGSDLPPAFHSPSSANTSGYFRRHFWRSNIVSVPGPAHSSRAQLVYGRPGSPQAPDKRK